MPEQIIRQKALALLNEPQEPLDIPIQRAVSALNVDALTVGHGYFHMPEFFRYPRNIYLSFLSKATKDVNGNYDSPIFQSNQYNGFKPLWQELREVYEKETNQQIDHIFFGNWANINEEDSFFPVLNSITEDAEWVFVKNTKGDISITRLTTEQRLHYQAQLEELRLNRAIKIIKEREARNESRACRENAIEYLTTRYHSTTDRFTFGEESFKFRQFNIEFLYISSELMRFEDFYKGQYLSYRFDEKIEEEWHEKSKQLNEMLMSSAMFRKDFLMSHAGPFKFSFRRDGCIVESDMLDEQTGKQFHKIILSQENDKILEILEQELTRIFERKRQMRRANTILQGLAARE